MNPERASPPLNVILVEDDPGTLASLTRTIEADRRLRLVATGANVADGRQLLRLAHEVAVIDIGLPDGSGLELIRESTATGAGRCLVTTIFGDEETVVAALEAGADGYILKDSADLAEAIVGVASGHVPLTPSVAAHLIRRFRPDERPDDERLTPRESETLSCLARGLTYRETAAKLGISYHTVTDHVKAIYRKLSVNSRSSAVYRGLTEGIISLGGDP